MGNYLKYFNAAKYSPNSWSIIPREGATYGFEDYGDNYVINSNQAAYSYCLCRIDIHTNSTHTLKIRYNANLYGSGNGSSGSNDKAWFSKLDTEFSLTGSPSTEQIFVTCTHSQLNYYEITYEIPEGHHFIDVKVYHYTYSTSGVTNKLIFGVTEFEQIEEFNTVTHKLDFETVITDYDVPLAEIIYTNSGTYTFDHEEQNRPADNFEVDKRIIFSSRRYVYKSIANDSQKRYTYSRRVDIGDFIYDSSDNPEKITKIKKDVNKVLYLNDQVYYNKKLLKRHVLDSLKNTNYMIRNFKQYKYINIETYSLSRTFGITGLNSYTGKQFYLTCMMNNKVVGATWSITSGSQYATVNQNGKVTINSGANSETIVVKAEYRTFSDTIEIEVTYDNQLVIEGQNPMRGTSGNVIARYNSTMVTPTWSLISGSQYATIDASGNIIILSTGSITIQATYSGYTITKQISVVYDSGSTSTTSVDENGNVTTKTTTVVENQDGSTMTTSTTEVQNEDGSSSSTSTVEVEYEDGSTQSVSTTTNSDGSSSSTQSQTNSDGSGESHTTNYDENGEPETGNTVVTDTSGNVDTQDVAYENGESVVTGYSIDTSNNEDGVKSLSGDGVNTEYYAFDMTHGFIININFTINFRNQPPDQNENHHNILTMKRATPQPWYGFQIRHDNTNSYITLGTQFSTGGNTNTNINGRATGVTNVYEYNLTITYNPTASGNKFICRNNITNSTVYQKDAVFPDLPELRYLKVALGFAWDEYSEPYRYSNVDIIDFNITRT